MRERLANASLMIGVWAIVASAGAFSLAPVIW